MKLIQTNDYLLLIDEGTKMKRGDYVICKRNKEIRYCTNKRLPDMFGDDGAVSNQPPSPYCHTQYYDVIAAYYPLTKEAKELYLPLLPNPFEETDIEMLAKDRATILFPKGELCANWRGCVEDFLTGYKAAQSKGQYSLEDMKKAHFHGWFQRENYETKNKETYPLPTNWSNMDYEEKEDWYFNQFIQSLSTQQLPKEFVPEYRKVTKYSFKDNYGQECFTFSGLQKNDVLISTQDQTGNGGFFITYRMLLIERGKEYKILKVSSFGFYTVPWIIDEDGNHAIPDYDLFVLKDEKLLKTTINPAGKMELIGKYK